MSQDIARDALRTEADALRDIADRIDQRFDEAVETILKTRGRVVVSGMGKSGIICKKIAATFASTGTPAFFLHPAEARHGDMGMMVDGDVVVVLSASGETAEVLRFVEFVKRINVSLIAIVGNLESALARSADIVLDVTVPREACLLNLAPTASTTAALAMGDALAIAVYTRRGFRPEDFARFHPGGQIGFRLVKVRDAMKRGEDLPRVAPGVTVQVAVLEMSAKKLGMTTVVDSEGKLLGILTDGDLRRLVERGVDLAKTAIDECMTREPAVIDADEPASKALGIMEKRKITSLLVADAEGRLEGVLHLHDLWRLQMF